MKKNAERGRKAKIQKESSNNLVQVLSSSSQDTQLLSSSFEFTFNLATKSEKTNENWLNSKSENSPWLAEALKNKAQEWLEKNYPDKGRWGTRTIYLNHQLAGILDCSEYKNLREIYISTSVDSSKLEIKKDCYHGRETTIIPCLLAQTWLDQNYPSNGTCIRKHEWKKGENHQDFGKTREEIKELEISEKTLEGTLDLSDFKNCQELNCSDNFLTNLKVNNCKELWKINCSYNQLTTLNLSNLAWLEELNCSNNYLTQIPAFPQPEEITKLDISNNYLSPSNLTIFSQLRNLRGLYIGNTNVKKICQNIYNRFVGSCEPLKDLNKLKWLDISNTDLDSGWEYLPASLENFDYVTWLRPACKLAQTKTELEQEIWTDIHQDFLPKHKKDWLAAGFNKEQTKKVLEEWSQFEIKPEEGAFINWFLNFKKLDLDWACENEEEFKELRDRYSSFGTCEECQQPNTSEKWCQSCNAQHFQSEFNTWTSGNFQIDTFIQKCQCEATSPWNALEWIPAEKFKNIEHIADGGFGKVEKAEWERGFIERWDNEKKDWERKGDYGIYSNKYKDYKTVALKTLSNSQNLSQDFLSELTLYKMFRSEVSKMVPCYGISRDREGNYIMVMQYMPEGNLREYLWKNYRELDLGSKLRFLQQITQGLKDIHRKKLVHRDFHSGNIVVDKGIPKDNCYITDLGLSQPVNETETENTIYGLMPYMAPEVLKGERYTPAADIYSLGMVLYELITGCPPYVEYAHDPALGARICAGIRPEFPSQLKYPQILVDLIKRCWDSEPNNRPTAREISGIIGEWFDEYGYSRAGTEFYHQLWEAEVFNGTKYPTYHSQEVWHSKPINTQQITNLLTSQGITLELDNLSIQNSPEESSPQAQIQIPPKQN